MTSKSPTLVIFAIILSSVSLAATADERASLLVNKGKSATSIQFMQGSNPITGIQFDFIIENQKSRGKTVTLNEVRVDSLCIQSVPTTHQVICGKQPDGSIRAIVYSGSNEILKTGDLGILPQASGVKIVDGSVIASDPAAKKVDVQTFN